MLLVEHAELGHRLVLKVLLLLEQRRSGAGIERGRVSHVSVFQQDQSHASAIFGVRKKISWTITYKQTGPGRSHWNEKRPFQEGRPQQMHGWRHASIVRTLRSWRTYECPRLC